MDELNDDTPLDLEEIKEEAKVLVKENKKTKKVSKKTDKKTKKKTEKNTKPKIKDTTLLDIEKDLKGYEFTLKVKGSKVEKPPYIIPFQHIGLNTATGGLIGATMMHIDGDSGSAKSFLLYELLAECQRMGGYTLLFDCENAWEDGFSRIVGLDLDAGTFMLSKLRDMDEVFGLAITFIAAVRKKKKNAPILIGIDSFAGLSTKIDLANMLAGESPRGFYHKQKNGKYSSHIDTFVPNLGPTKTTFVMINQIRIKTKTSGKLTIEYKEALCETINQFWSTQRLRGTLVHKDTTKEVDSLNSKGTVKVKDSIKTVWETIKNRKVKPFQKITVKVMYDTGLKKYSGLIEYFVNNGFVKPSTTSFDIDGNKLLNADGSEQKKKIKGYKRISDDKFYYNTKDMVKDNPEFLKPRLTIDAIQDSESMEDFE